MTEASPKRRSFDIRLGIPFRSKSTSRAGSVGSGLVKHRVEDVKHRVEDVKRSSVSGTRLRISSDYESSSPVKGNRSSVNGRHSHDVSRKDALAVDVSQQWERDKQTGEVIDHTDMLHSLVEHDSYDPVKEAQFRALQEGSLPGAHVVSKLSSEIWMRVIDHLTLADIASLAFSCKAFQDLLGLKPWNALNDPENHHQRIKFLLHMNKYLPGHLLCFPCATYHVRTQHGQESLKPANIFNPLFNCANSSNPKKAVSRIRITFGRTLPFTFVQLAMRAHHHTADHGITVDSLSRRYKDREGTWSHQTRFVIVNGHLLMRVISSCFATPGLPPAGLRNLLYSREDFVPYFSVCAHWRDGELMPMVKCALGHIPKPLEGSGLKRLGQEAKAHMQHKPSPIIVLCSQCRPMRRCPECPTEYLIELKMAEDRSDPVHIFKQALVVTRWSDLGDGSSPLSPEWAAIDGETEFDSFTAIGKRAISGIFESESSIDMMPGQRIISMNPNHEKLGERGHNWY